MSAQPVSAPVSAAVRACEKHIALPGFLPESLCDRARVYAIARIFDAGVRSLADVEQMVILAPSLYEALLRIYTSLLAGKSQLWWQRVQEASSPRWTACVRSAIQRMAAASGVPVDRTADFLDHSLYPGARNHALTIAREILRTQYR